MRTNKKRPHPGRIQSRGNHLKGKHAILWQRLQDLNLRLRDQSPLHCLPMLSRYIPLTGVQTIANLGSAIPPHLISPYGCGAVP